MLCRFLFIAAITISHNAIALAPECPNRSASGASAISADQFANIIGVAKDPESQQPLYCEYHYIQASDSNNQVLVEYRDLEQNIIAQKKLVYPENRLQPEVFQKDFRHGERREVAFSKDANVSAVTGIDITYVKPDTEQAKQATVEVNERLVIDAGFDAAVRQQWSSIVAGETVRMDFLSPIHLRTFNLSIKRVSDEDCQLNVSGSGEELCFMIRPSNVLMNLLAKPLWLVYEKETQRLLTYQGNVNLTTLDGDTLEASIRYYYR